MFLYLVFELKKTRGKYSFNSTILLLLPALKNRISAGADSCEEWELIREIAEQNWVYLLHFNWTLGFHRRAERCLMDAVTFQQQKCQC